MSISLDAALKAKDNEDEHKKAVQCVHKFAHYLKKKTLLKIKDTVIVKPQTKRTKFFRGDELLTVMESSKDEIEKIFKVFCIDITSKEKLKAFLSNLMEHRLLFRMDRKPEPVNDSPDAKKGKKKWPKEVYLSPTQYFDDKAFYNWSFDDPASGYWGYIIVISIMAILLFPVWPDIGKIVVFYMSLYTLIFLVVSPDPARRDFDKTGDLPRGEGIRV